MALVTISLLHYEECSITINYSNLQASVRLIKIKLTLTTLWFEKRSSGDYIYEFRASLKLDLGIFLRWRGPKSMDEIDGSPWPDLPPGSATGGSTVAET